MLHALRAHARGRARPHQRAGRRLLQPGARRQRRRRGRARLQARGGAEDVAALPRCVVPTADGGLRGGGDADCRCSAPPKATRRRQRRRRHRPRRRGAGAAPRRGRRRGSQARRRGGSVGGVARRGLGAAARAADRAADGGAYDMLELLGGGLSAPPKPPTPPSRRRRRRRQRQRFVGVWLGARTAKGAEAAGSVAARTRPASTGCAPSTSSRAQSRRTGGWRLPALLSSNGASAHHWQHRVFPDGDVLELLIDDASEVPERAAGTRRLLRIYAALVGGARSAMRAAAAAARKAAARSSPMRLVRSPPRRSRRRRRRGRPARRLARQQADRRDAVACAVEGGGGRWRRLHGARAAAAAAPAEWLGLHFTRGGARRAERGRRGGGPLVFEEPLRRRRRGRWRRSGVLTRLGAAVPDVSCWGATPEEEREARQVRGALSGVSVCGGVNPSALEKMRAGEHSVLQLLAAAPIDTAALLTSSPWLRVVTGEVRLFSGGLSIDSPRHGPLTIPFRVHPRRRRRRRPRVPRRRRPRHSAPEG